MNKEELSLKSPKLRMLIGGAATLLLAFQLLAADEPALTRVADPKPILAELQEKMAALTSVYLEFTQERQLKLFTDPLKSEGVMMIDRPGLIRWQTTAPYQSILLGNAKSVAQFEFADGKWTKLKLGFPQMLRGVMDQMSLMHQGKFDALAKDFTISVATGAVTAVTLEPKDENLRAMLAQLEIRVSPDYSGTRELVMREPGGDQTRIVFNHEIRGAKLPEGTFDQTNPIALEEIKKSVGVGK